MANASESSSISEKTLDMIEKRCKIDDMEDNSTQEEISKMNDIDVNDIVKGIFTSFYAKIIASLLLGILLSVIGLLGSVLYLGYSTGKYIQKIDDFQTVHWPEMKIYQQDMLAQQKEFYEKTGQILNENVDIQRDNISNNEKMLLKMENIQESINTNNKSMLLKMENILEDNQKIQKSIITNNNSMLLKIENILEDNQKIQKSITTNNNKMLLKMERILDDNSEIKTDIKDMLKESKALVGQNQQAINSTKDSLEASAKRLEESAKRLEEASKK